MQTNKAHENKAQRQKAQRKRTHRRRHKNTKNKERWHKNTKKKGSHRKKTKQTNKQRHKDERRHTDGFVWVQLIDDWLKLFASLLEVRRAMPRVVGRGAVFRLPCDT